MPMTGYFLSLYSVTSKRARTDVVEEEDFHGTSNIRVGGTKPVSIAWLLAQYANTPMAPASTNHLKNVSESLAFPRSPAQVPPASNRSDHQDINPVYSSKWTTTQSGVCGRMCLHQVCRCANARKCVPPSVPTEAGGKPSTSHSHDRAFTSHGSTNAAPPN